MARKHGQTTYFIAGEGFVGDGEARPGVLSPAPGPPPDEERAFRFSRMFPTLDRFRPDTAALIALGRIMDDTPNFKDHPTLPAGFTYLGQFIDHDITFDKTEGLPDSELSEDEIVQGRSPSLDLDSLYGRGPDLETKPLYESDGVRLRIGQTVGFGGVATEPESLALPNDLPRGDDPEKPFEASIGDPRNDENLAVAQTHLAFLKFHNVVAAGLAETGLSGSTLFERARRTVTLHYQWIVLYDFLPRVIDPTILRGVLNGGRQFFHLDPGEEPSMPIEFSVAAYRFGHSMIRDAYSWNRNFPDSSLGLLFVFSGVNGQMISLPSTWPIDWRRFYDFQPAGIEAPPALNKTRSIDTALALGLKTIPEFATEGSKAPLAVRNLLRGRVLGLPSGQAVAQAMGVPPMTPEQIRQGPHADVLQAHGFDQQTPLWYYILKEAEVLAQGQRLGPVGSLLLAETFVGLIQAGQTSILTPANEYWRPTLPSLRPGHFTMVDLLLLVNDLNPLGAERRPPRPPVRIHVVQPGDTLSGLAARFFGDERLWRIIFDANRDIISDPNLIRPGMELVIPPAPP